MKVSHIFTTQNLCSCHLDGATTFQKNNCFTIFLRFLIFTLGFKNVRFYRCAKPGCEDCVTSPDPITCFATCCAVRNPAIQGTKELKVFNSYNL